MRFVFVALLMVFSVTALADSSGVMCMDDNDCIGLGNTPVCVANHCSSIDEGGGRPECTFDRDCPRGRPCINQQCTRPGNACTFDRECPRGYPCINRQCTQAGNACTFDRECPRGYACKSRVCLRR